MSAIYETIQRTEQRFWERHKVMSYKSDVSNFGLFKARCKYKQDMFFEHCERVVIWMKVWASCWGFWKVEQKLEEKPFSELSVGCTVLKVTCKQWRN